ncbi:MAG: hypothetical protein ABIN18_22375 [Pseudomonadota bacterium]
MEEKSIHDQVFEDFLESLKKSKEFPDSKLDDLRKFMMEGRPLNKREFLKILSSEG